MADDQGQKTVTTIDDLVKELSTSGGQKPSQGLASSQPPANLPGIKVNDPLPSMSKPDPIKVPPMPSPKPSVPSTPSMPPINMPPVSPKPNPTTQPSTTPPSTPSDTPIKPVSPIQPRPMSGSLPQPPAQEYKSSIRTMGGDISDLKSGQKPFGVDVPRKIAQEAPRVDQGMRRPAIQTEQQSTGPISSIGLGKAEKTATLPMPPITGKTDLAKPPIGQPPIIVPPPKRGPVGSFNPKFFMLIGLIIITGGFLYWYLVVRVSEPKVVLTPTPSESVSPTPLTKNLNEIFIASSSNFEVSTSPSLGNEFRIFIDSLVSAAKSFLMVNLTEEVNSNLVPISFLDMFDAGLVNYPQDWRNNVLDSVLLVYGQSEKFNVDGSINLNTSGIKKTVFVTRVKNKIVIENMMKDWESTIAKDLANYLLINNTKKEANVSFLDNTYQGISIRYKNFPFPDETIDYSVFEYKGQNYLVIAGSREAMYATLDVLLNQ